ncbi:hypothetical protein [Agrococcus sp. KRD186]|uniref:hypothetical protein n=1 Tax=Agrococcus sp. KRD186 TaxID=2729730 RepID=UPI0019D00EA2|nr:hypothetical protein [Agrococcus sp. KRD186]
MRYPNHIHEHTDQAKAHQGEQPERSGHPRSHGRFHRGGMGPHMHHGMHHGQHCEQHQGTGGEHPRGGAHRRPALERSIMKSARRIRRSGLAPEQLHRRIAATVSHADYMTTLRTLRRIGMELRSDSADTAR